MDDRQPRRRANDHLDNGAGQRLEGLILTQTDRQLRIAIVDDSLLLREGLGRLIEDAGFVVAGTFADGDDLLAALPGLAQDLIVMDVRMPPSFTEEGVRLALDLRRRNGPLPILILSQFVESVYAQELFSNGEGAIGYLLKDRISSIEIIYDAITRIAAGGTVLDPEVVSTLITARKDPLGLLTPRELDVLATMAQGMTNQAIAQALDIGTGTVEKHIATIFSKLDLAEDPHEHRRVLAVLKWLRGR